MRRRAYGLTYHETWSTGVAVVCVGVWVLLGVKIWKTGSTRGVRCVKVLKQMCIDDLGWQWSRLMYTCSGEVRSFETKGLA
jgi:hypothetical protein